MSELTSLVWLEERPDAASVDPAYLEEGRTCGYRGCNNPATWALRRQYRPIQGRSRGRWWRYCPEHNYGRIFRDGAVWGRAHRDSPAHLAAIEQGRHVLDAPELEEEFQALQAWAPGSGVRRGGGRGGTPDDGIGAMIARGIWLFRWIATGVICERIGERDDWILGVVYLLIAVALAVQADQIETQRKFIVRITDQIHTIARILAITSTTGQEATSTTEEAKDARQQRKQQ